MWVLDLTSSSKQLWLLLWNRIVLYRTKSLTWYRIQAEWTYPRHNDSLYRTQLPFKMWLVLCYLLMDIQNNLIFMSIRAITCITQYHRTALHELHFVETQDLPTLMLIITLISDSRANNRSIREVMKNTIKTLSTLIKLLLKTIDFHLVRNFCTYTIYSVEMLGDSTTLKWNDGSARS